MNELKIPNFKRGMRVDNIDEDDQILSLRNMVNADIDFRTGAAVRRNGYSYFLQALAAQAKQIEEFYDTVGRSNLLLIMDEKLYWYRSSNTTLYEVKNASVSPTTSLDFATYDHYPFLTVGDRCFFADDNGFWWVDNTSLVWESPPATPLPLCYQVGIDKPANLDVSLEVTVPFGHDVVSVVGEGLWGGTPEKQAQSFQITSDMTIDAVELYQVRTGFVDIDAGVKLNIYPDSGGLPDETDSLAVAIMDMHSYPTASSDWTRYSFTSRLSLTASTTYWIVIEGDTAYDSHADVANYVAWFYDALGGYVSGEPRYYQAGAWHTYVGNIDFLFHIGGQLEPGMAYRYKYAYYNDTYVIESEPNDEYLTQADMVVNTVDTNPLNNFGDEITTHVSLLPNPTDEQITHIRIYRTKGNETIPYYYVADVVKGTTTYIDAIADDNLGNELQADDHTRLTDRDENLIVPRQLEWWQHRIWAVPAKSDTFYYSKRLEEAGATGIAGDPVYDYFPQESTYRNDWDVDSTIIAMKVHEGRLIIYTDRHDVHIFSGATQPLNPPPDLSHDPLIIGEGILDYRGLVDLRGKHVFITQDHEIKGFVGTIDMEDISDVMDSVLADLTTIHAFVWDNQYMLLGDSNADGVMDTIYILDLSRRVLSPWRKYEYKNNTTVVEIKDVVLTNAGVLYAVAKVGSVYHVIQLDSGTSDGWTALENDGTAITKTLQTHDIRPARRAFWQEVGIRGYYPTSTIPTYVTTCTDLTGETTVSAFDPTGSEDMLGHTHGLRMASNELSLKIESTGVEKDEIRELFVRYRL